MTTEKRDVRIGQEAFALSPDGEVIRTVVARIERNGYQLLNGYDYCRPHWFSFEEAVCAASSRINDRQKSLRKELRALANKRRALGTQNYRDGVKNAPYRVVDLRDTTVFVRLLRSRTLKNVRVPEEYLMPGAVVYAIITPATRLVSEEYGYRPHKHFILETEVESVCFSPDGQVHYTFSTPFIIGEEFFLSMNDAEKRLRVLSAPRSGNFVRFVSREEEKRELEKIEDDVPF